MIHSSCRAVALLAVIFAFGILTPHVPAGADGAEQVIQVTAKRFEYSPGTLTVKKGIPVVLEFRSLDRLHGFDCPGLKIRSDIPPGNVTTLRFTPQTAGSFPFHCDIFCGNGHEEMTGMIVVTE